MLVEPIADPASVGEVDERLLMGLKRGLRVANTVASAPKVIPLLEILVPMRSPDNPSE
ncbi:MAG: hypothetical protein ACTH30_04110 [Leucobacter sp.]